MIIGFHHPGLVVTDLELAKQFYSEALGFTFIRSYGWDASQSEQAERTVGVAGTTTRCYLMRCANCFLELFEYLTPSPVGDPGERRACDFGIAHLAFQVQDIHAVFARWIEAGGQAHHEPVQVGEGWSIYVRDPFGNIIELMEIGADEPDFDLIQEKMLPVEPGD